MAQDPSEPTAEPVGLPGSGDPATCGTILRPRYGRSWLAASLPASKPTTSFRTSSSAWSGTGYPAFDGSA